ncbi:hypothetical protein D3C80_2099880 [compost metagenome]
MGIVRKGENRLIGILAQKADIGLFLGHRQLLLVHTFTDEYSNRLCGIVGNRQHRLLNGGVIPATPGVHIDLHGHCLECSFR